jgi:nucleotide-binding universal stress UspA family protein
MGKYKKILVAFDGSVSSKNALKQAIKFSETEKCWIKVIAVVPSYEGDLELIGVSNIKEVLKGPAERLIAEARDIAESEKATIITNVEQGEAYERIVDIAEAENCDIIVMGRRGRHRLERALMGGVTAQVIGHSKKDVLVVPRDAVLGWKNILLATDGSKYSEAAADHAIDFAKSYGSKLSVISVVNVTEEFYALAPDAVDKMILKSRTMLDGIREKAESAGMAVETFVKEGEPHSKIVELANEKKADVIFMGSHGRTGITRILMGAVTERVIGKSSCPVLVVRI